MVINFRHWSLLAAFEVTDLRCFISGYFFIKRVDFEKLFASIIFLVR